MAYRFENDARADSYAARQVASFERSYGEELKRLLKITADCRPDMHEPDEQEISAKVIGDHLDNAFGNSIMPPSCETHGYGCGLKEATCCKAQHQEFVVELRKGKGKIQRFNLADLIALARMAVVKYPED